MFRSTLKYWHIFTGVCGFLVAACFWVADVNSYSGKIDEIHTVNVQNTAEIHELKEDLRAIKTKTDLIWEVVKRWK